MSDVTRWIRPGARTDFTFGLDDGDTITDHQVVMVTDSSTLAVDGGTVVDVTLDGVEYSAAGVLVWVSGGAVGDRGIVRCTITTSSGRRDTKELGLVVGFHD